MQWSAILLATAMLVHCIQADFSWTEVTNSQALQSGEGTFYGADQDAQGTCSFSGNFANTNDLPWTSGTAMTLALNDNQFGDSAACGLCVKFRGTGAGLGTTPIPSSWTSGFVNNRCPECSNGDLDLAASGDGRWKIEWYAVPCNTGDSALVYSIVVSSYYWFSLVVSNTRVPITGVSVNIGGSWLALKRTNNNQWAYYNTNGPWQSSFPMGIQVTSVTGETISDQITSVSGNSGTVQFSETGSGTGVAATGAATGSTATATGPTGSSSGSGPTGGSVLPTLSSPPPAAQTDSVATPPALPVATPPVSLSPPAPLVEGGFYIENYQQCGGGGGACNNKPYTAAPCADAAWEKATCRSTGFACLRAGADFWSCIPGVATTPPVASPPQVGSTPPTQGATPPQEQYGILAVAGYPPASASQTPPAQLSTPPVASTQAAVSPPIQAAAAQSPPAIPPTSIETQAPTPTATSTSSPTATSTSSPTASSTPTSTPPSAVAAASTTSTSSNSIAITAGGQCGGTSNCDPAGQATDKVTCNSGPWTGAYCPSGYSCQANPGPLVWTCLSSSTATAGRRLLESR